MSKESLEHLRDYIQLTLTPSDLSWLMGELIVSVQKNELLTPYTKEELQQRIVESEQQIAAGCCKTAEESLAELESMFADEPTMMETV